MIKNIYLNKGEEAFLRMAGVFNLNFSDYVKKLISIDIKQKENSILLQQIKVFEYESKKKEYINNIKLLGAINNIDHRIKGMSTKETRKVLITQMLNLLNTEKDNIKDLEIKEIIVNKIKFLEGVLNVGNRTD